MAKQRATWARVAADWKPIYFFFYTCMCVQRNVFFFFSFTSVEASASSSEAAVNAVINCISRPFCWTLTTSQTVFRQMNQTANSGNNLTASHDNQGLFTLWDVSVFPDLSHFSIYHLKPLITVSLSSFASVIQKPSNFFFIRSTFKLQTTPRCSFGPPCFCARLLEIQVFQNITFKRPKMPT